MYAPVCGALPMPTPPFSAVMAMSLTFKNYKGFEVVKLGVGASMPSMLLPHLQLPPPQRYFPHHRHVLVDVPLNKRNLV